MAITVTELTANSSDTDATSYATASVSPSANKLILVCMMNTKTVANASQPTVTGNGLTWSLVKSQLDVAGTRRVSVIRSMSSSAPSSGAITLDFGANTQTSCAWIVVEIDGVVTSGSGGANAVVQSNGNNAAGGSTSLTVTLSSAILSGDASVGIFSHAANETTTVGSGYTSVDDKQNAAPNGGTMLEWRSTGQTTVDASWATGAGAGGVALEVRVWKTKTHNINSILLQTQTKIQGIDASIVIRDILHYNIDTVIKRTWYQHNIDAYIHNFGTKSHNISAAIGVFSNKIRSNLDFILNGGRIRQQKISALLKQKPNKTHNISAYIIKPGLPQHNISARIKATLTQTHKISAIIDHALSATRTFTISVIVVRFFAGFYTPIKLAGIELSDHNRAPLGIGRNIVDARQRSVDGLLGRLFTIEKRTFSFNWSMLPSYSGETVDGRAGRLQVKELVETNRSMTLEFTDYDNSLLSIKVKVVSYREELAKRRDSYYWNITLDLEEL